MARNRITKSELDFFLIGGAIAIMFSLIVDPIQEMLTSAIPDPTTRIAVGVGLLISGAYFWDLRNKRR